MYAEYAQYIQKGCHKKNQKYPTNPVGAASWLLQCILPSLVSFSTIFSCMGSYGVGEGAVPLESRTQRLPTLILIVDTKKETTNLKTKHIVKLNHNDIFVSIWCDR